jgi:hypothetical protein
MSFEVEQALRPELGSDERLLWSGMPGQGIRFRAGDIFMVPFSLLWAGFAFFWEYSVNSAGAPLLFQLWGIPFVLVGLYIVIGRFFLDSYQRARTYYGVTNQRVIILSGLMSRQVKSLTLEGLDDISLSERSDQSGTVTFGPINPMYAMWSGTSWPGMGKRLAPAFDMVDEARRVYDLVRDAQRARMATAAKWHASA